MVERSRSSSRARVGSQHQAETGHRAYFGECLKLGNKPPFVPGRHLAITLNAAFAFLQIDWQPRARRTFCRLPSL